MCKRDDSAKLQEDGGTATAVVFFSFFSSFLFFVKDKHVVDCNSHSLALTGQTERQDG